MIPGMVSITFDLDGLQRNPFAVEPTAEQRQRLHDVAADTVLPRIMNWLRSLDVPATFFAIGQDVQRSPAIYRTLVAAGHEIGNHSASHLRDFSRQPASVIRDEISRGGDIIGAATGTKPVGFRAPGYTVTPEVIDALTALGYAYKMRRCCRHGRTPH